MFFLYETTLPLHRSFQNGQWSEGQLTEDAELHISESSPALHYGQQAFEGLKAYRTKEENSSSFVLTKMLSVCNELLTACSWSLYRLTFSSRPARRWSKPTRTTFLPMELVVPLSPPAPDWRRRHHRRKTSRRVHFHSFAMPVGNYFKGGLAPTNFSFKTSTTVLHQTVQVQLRLVVTTRRRSYRANMPKAGLLRCHLPGPSYPHQD